MGNLYPLGPVIYLYLRGSNSSQEAGHRQPCSTSSRRGPLQLLGTELVTGRLLRRDLPPRVRMKYWALLKYIEHGTELRPRASDRFTPSKSHWTFGNMEGELFIFSFMIIFSVIGRGRLCMKRTWSYDANGESASQGTQGITSSVVTLATMLVLQPKRAELQTGLLSLRLRCSLWTQSLLLHFLVSVCLLFQVCLSIYSFHSRQALFCPYHYSHPVYVYCQT